jgi:hypothetical protein
MVEPLCGEVVLWFVFDLFARKVDIRGLGYWVQGYPFKVNRSTLFTYPMILLGKSHVAKIQTPES